MAERFTSRWDTVAFVVCLALAAVARVAPDGVQEVMAAGTRLTVLAPLLAIQHQAELFRTYRTRLTGVMADRDSMAMAAMDVTALREENDRLRELLALAPRLQTEFVSAEVLHQAGPADGLTLLLSAGSAQGIHSLAPVLAPKGLIGVVRSADRTHAVAIGWQNPDFRASAMTLDGEVFGIVAPSAAGGAGAPLLELTGVPFGQRVAPGTRLYTAGFGAVYPRGIPIGEVIGEGRETEGLSRTYLVQPAAHPASVSHVIVLIGRVLDLTDAFAR